MDDHHAHDLASLEVSNVTFDDFDLDESDLGGDLLWSPATTVGSASLGNRKEPRCVVSRKCSKGDLGTICVYPLVISHSYWEWPFVVDFLLNMLKNNDVQ